MTITRTRHYSKPKVDKNQKETGFAIVSITTEKIDDGPEVAVSVKLRNKEPK